VLKAGYPHCRSTYGVGYTLSYPPGEIHENPIRIWKFILVLGFPNTCDSVWGGGAAAAPSHHPGIILIGEEAQHEAACRDYWNWGCQSKWRWA
jgi:hypothetical protein